MRWLLTPALLFLWMTVMPQSSIQFDRYTVEQGLSDNFVGDVVQDDNGFTWLATANGLNRFDGVQFKNFFRTAGNSQIPDNFVSHIRKWKDHLLVISTRNGLGIFNPRNSQCQSIHIPSQKGISRQTNSILDMEVTSNNEIVVGSVTGVYVFNDRLQLIASIEAGYKAKDIGTRRFLFCVSISVLSNGDVLAETTSGLEFYDHQKKTFFPLTKHPNASYRRVEALLLRHPHHIINIDRHNRLFCINYAEPKNQVTVFDLSSGKTIISPFPANDVAWDSKICFHNDTLISINSNIGGFYTLSFDPISLEVRVDADRILRNSLGTKLMMDGEKRWWACTNNGLFEQSLIKQQFKNVEIASFLENKNSSEGIIAIYRYKRKLYIGLESVYGGVMIFDENDQFVRKIDFTSLHPGCNMIWNIDKWNDDTLIIGTQSGVVLLNTNNYRFSRVNYPGWPTTANESPITIDYIDRHGTRWMGLGNTNGVLAFYSRTRTWKHFSPGDKHVIFKLRYPTQIAEDNDGNIWMIHTTEGGLVRWNYQKQTFDTLVRRFNDLDAGENDFNCLASDNEGNLWMYLQNHGIICWDQAKHRVQKYRFQSYWQNENVQALYAGIPGQLWVILRQSLSVMNLRTGAVKMFTKANGLPDYSATGIKFYYDTLTEELMLGFTNSFTQFRPFEIFKKEERKKIFITEINILNDTTQPDPQKTVKLRYSQNDLSIHFSAVDYEHGHENSYEYRLFEYENSPWIDIGHQQSINLNNLPAGKYIFQVRLSSPTANNNQAIASTTIIIIPPFYRTWWFYALCAIALVLAFYILYRMRIRQLIQVQQVRNRISSDLHDDIGSRLTNIQILSALGEQKLEQPEQASIYLHRIVNEVQTSGEALDDIVWSINSKNDSGEELAARMRRYVAEIFETDHVLCTMNVNDNFSAIKMTMEKRRDFYLVFKEALNNVLKHSQASAVHIELLAQNNNVLMHIADNGKGFDVSQPVNRNGLKNIKKRIEKWKGKVMIESAASKGTALHIVLPVHGPSLKWTIWKRLHLS
jgi:ligand-binding sensor domain-containing protein/two-component sensor histidine kinase